MAKITPLGGSQEVGRNCFALDVDDTLIILDMGFHLEHFLKLSEDEFPSSKNHTLRRFMSGSALPDIRYLRKDKKRVKGIVCSHAHLDHIAAIPFLINRFRCPIYATPFTASVIRSLCQEKHIDPKIIQINPGESFMLDSLKVEFVSVAHSTPQSVAIAIHSSEGVILYANDFKIDREPPFEEETDMKTLKSFSGKTKAIILDSLYAPVDDSCLSESNARNQVLELKDKLQNHRAIFASTFSSHIHRIHSLIDLANSLNRKVVFVGRSLCKYLTAAKESGVIDLISDNESLCYKRKIRSFFSKPFDPKDYFFILTGHQGEPRAALSRLVDEFFTFTNDDAVVFSCNVIPVPISIENRKILETKLSRFNVTIYKDVHVSGHAHAKDHEKLISLLKPEFVFPVHGIPKMQDAMISIAKSLDVPNVNSLKVGTPFKF